MAQQLIVEGNDAIALANLLMKRGLAPPRGYDIRIKFEKEFIKTAGGYNNIPKAIREALDNADLKNLGIIIDADSTDVSIKFNSIKEVILEKLGDKIKAEDILLNDSGTVFQENDKLKIGIWVMPDNQSSGYLEHFLSKLVDQDDELWLHVQNTISELEAKHLKRFSAPKEQKAILHTWLAWQKDPGKPFGQAIANGSLNAHSPSADNFVQWFTQTFELSST